MDAYACAGLRGLGVARRGFSWNSRTRPSASALMMPKEEAFSSGTPTAATVASASRAQWKSIIWRTSMR